MLLHTGAMFEKWVQAEAVILEDEGSGSVVDTDLHGVDWDHHKYILEVRPAGEPPFRVETKAKVPIFHAPSQGDTVVVNYDPKQHKTEIVIEGDPRYDPKLIRAQKKQDKQDRAAHAQAVLSGAAVPDPPAIVDDLDDEPRWKVPETCPECGARVDQSRASMAEHPTCEYCEKPLPCEPLPDY
jgi:hypothetical protein